MASVIIPDVIRKAARTQGSSVPTVLREGPYRFFWYSHEPGEPPHVHVDCGERSAKFWLRPVALARNMGYSAHELRKIRTIVESRQAAFLEAWHGYFGG